MKKLVVLSGAGVSAESGIKTFRDSDGLWENYNVADVADIDGWYRNPGLVLKFYNERRHQLEKAQPNRAHEIIAKYFPDKVELLTANPFFSYISFRRFAFLLRLDQEKVKQVEEELKALD